jgi:CHAT domain-containing protein/Tfp pilus assembly protein PilF
LKLAEKCFGSESAQSAQVLASLGNTCSDARQFDRAKKYLKRSLEIREQLPGISSTAVATSLCNLGSFYARWGDYSQGMPLLQRGINLLEQSVGPKDIQSIFLLVSALNSFGVAEVESGDLEKGISTLKGSLTVTETNWGAASINLVSTLNTLAVAYHRQGDFQMALPLLERALRILEDAPPEKTPQFADSLNNLAELFRSAGDEASAARLFNRSAELAESQFGPDYVSLAYSLNGLGLIYQNRGDAPRAFKSFQRSLGILETNFGNSHPDIAGVLNNIAALYDITGDTNRALTTFRRVLAIQETVLPGSNPAIATTLNNLAVNLRGRGQLTEAHELMSKSLAITDAVLGKNNPESCARLENLGIIEILSGDQTKGLTEFVESAKRWRRYLAAQMTSRQGPGPLRIQEKIQASRDWFHSLCGVGDGTFSRLAAASGAEQLAASKALLEEVETIGARLAADDRPQVRDLREQARVKRGRLSTLAALGEGAAWAAERTAWRTSERDKLEQELGQIEDRIAATAESVGAIIREQDLSLADVARSLPSDSVLVDFVQYRRTDFSPGDRQWREQRYAVYLTFPLTPDSTNIAVKRVDLGEAAPVDEAIALITSRMSAGQYAAKDVELALQHLSDLVYAPIAKQVTNAQHLIICPDGQLSRFPFESLRTGERFVVEAREISYVTSGREVVRLKRSAEDSSSTGPALVMGAPDFDLNLTKVGSPNLQIVGFGRVPTEAAEMAAESRSASQAAVAGSAYRGIKFPALPGAEAEARNVAKLLGEGVVLLVGPNAREALLKRVASPRVLHLATHGFFLSDQDFRRINPPFSGGPDKEWQAGRLQEFRSDWVNPMLRCGIALAGANRALEITNSLAEDGLLTGLEASLLSLQGTKLVILSACDSGSGEVKIGEGVLSLRRAFRIAGAETVLASHWKVSDRATTRLMTEFVERWRTGKTRGQAWHEAQLALLRSKEFSDPYFWAAFTITGQWR